MIRLRLKDFHGAPPKSLAKKLWTARAPNLQRLSGASRASHVQNFGRIWRRDFEGARGGKKSLSPISPPLRELGRWFFCRQRASAGHVSRQNVSPLNSTGDEGRGFKQFPLFSLSPAGQAITRKLWPGSICFMYQIIREYRSVRSRRPSGVYYMRRLAASLVGRLGAARCRLSCGEQ